MQNKAIIKRHFERERERERVSLGLHVVQPDARVSLLSLALAKTIWFC